MMLLVGFGYAEPVPINPNYFKHRKTGMAITAFAGPFSNLLLSFIAGFVVIAETKSNVMIFGATTYYQSTFHLLLYLFFYYMHMMNLYLAVFNMIPVPPLDGSRILFIFLPAKYYFKVMKYEQYIAIGLIALLYIGILDGPLSFITSGISNGLLNLADLII